MNTSLLGSIQAQTTNSVSEPHLQRTGAIGHVMAAVAEPTPLPRPAWIEIDVQRLRSNFQLINQDKPQGLQLLSVIKDDGYGHGALTIARAALDSGAAFLALCTLQEAITL